MLTPVKIIKKLDESVGIILGNFKNCVPKDYDSSLTLEEVIYSIIKPLNKPTISNFQKASLLSTITIPFGVKARLNAHEKKLIY